MGYSGSDHFYTLVAMKIQEIINALNLWAPPAYQEPYDNATLIAGSPQSEVTGVLVTLDCTEAVVAEAIHQKANMIVAHHPIVFKGLRSLTGKTYVERTVIQAIRHDIAIFSLHTNLDNVSSGVNRKIAEKIGLKDCQILSPKRGMLSKIVTFIPHEAANEVIEALHRAGAGHIGNYEACSFRLEGKGTFKPSELASPTIGQANEKQTVEETRVEVLLPSHLKDKVVHALKAAHPYEEVAYYLTALENENQEVGAGMVGLLEHAVETPYFFEKLKRLFGLACIRHTPFIRSSVQKIAVCGGAGSFLLPQAKAAGADVFITADFKYHEFFDAEDQIVIADVGHYESEAFTKELMGDFLKESFPKIAVCLSQVNTNPVKYF